MQLSCSCRRRAARSAPAICSGRASTPDSSDVADALNTYGGWFILFPDLPADPTVFIQQAQVYLANSARAGALIAWFSNPDQAAQGLTAWVLTAPRSGGAGAGTRSGPACCNSPTSRSA